MSGREGSRPAPALVVGNLPPPVTGAAAASLALAEALERTREVRRASLSPGGARGPGRHLLRSARALAAAYAMLQLRFAGGRRLHLALDGGFGRLYALGLLAAARCLGLAVHLQHHSFAYVDRPDRLMRALLGAAGADAVHVFLSAGMRARFEAAYGPCRSAVVSNAALLPTPEGFRRRRCGERLAIGHLANLDAAKGLHDMIALAREIAARGLRAEVRLAGPVRNAEDRARLEAALADPRLPLSWSGPLHGSAKAAFYAGLDVFALPSRHADEAQPLVIWEAALAGVPTLAWRRGALAEQIGAPERLLDPSEPFAPWAADRLEAWLASPEALAAAGAAARRHALGEAAAGRAALAALIEDGAPAAPAPCAPEAAR